MLLASALIGNMSQYGMFSFPSIRHSYLSTFSENRSQTRLMRLSSCMLLVGRGKKERECLYRSDSGSDLSSSHLEGVGNSQRMRDYWQGTNEIFHSHTDVFRVLSMEGERSAVSCLHSPRAFAKIAFQVFSSKQTTTKESST